MVTRFVPETFAELPDLFNEGAVSLRIDLSRLAAQEADEAGRPERAEEILAKYSRIELGVGSGVSLLRDPEAVREAVAKARAAQPAPATIEVEVETLDELREALDARVDRVLLDNMGPALMREAVALSQHSGCPLAMHLAETEAELEFMAQVHSEGVLRGRVGVTLPD